MTEFKLLEMQLRFKGKQGLGARSVFEAGRQEAFGVCRGQG